jgi:hypothetical protein
MCLLLIKLHSHKAVYNNFRTSLINADTKAKILYQKLNSCYSSNHVINFKKYKNKHHERII